MLRVARRPTSPPFHTATKPIQEWGAWGVIASGLATCCEQDAGRRKIDVRWDDARLEAALFPAKVSPAKDPTAERSQPDFVGELGL